MGQGGQSLRRRNDVVTIAPLTAKGRRNKMSYEDRTITRRWAQQEGEAKLAFLHSRGFGDRIFKYYCIFCRADTEQILAQDLEGEKVARCVLCGAFNPLKEKEKKRRNRLTLRKQRGW